MLDLDNPTFTVHHDKDKFISYVDYSAANTGFDQALIEKDYFCSLILYFLSKRADSPLIFKGGTLLAKAYTVFYRLSEDLDFSISVPPDVSRTYRESLIKPVKLMIDDMVNYYSELKIESALKGSNESRHYQAVLRYPSQITNGYGRILIELDLREEILMPKAFPELNTLLLNPFSNRNLLPAFSFQALSKDEAYAEKMRAALCRQKLAISDFYDLGYARDNHILDFYKESFIELVKKKTNLENSNFVMFDAERIVLLKQKIKTELIPTLKLQDAYEFDLETTLEWLLTFRSTHLS